MKISATSALVLNWTEKELWQSLQASAYFKHLDLSEGTALLELFSDEEQFMHRQAVSGRKYFMKKKVTGFLDNLQKQGVNGQVIILAAGLAPLSIEISSLFPSCRLFDVDKFLMGDKKDIVNGNPPNINFIECDITDVKALGENLIRYGFDTNVPAIVAMEGILYYIKSADLKNILKYFGQHEVALACDFCLRPRLVNDKTRFFLTELFRKIKNQVRLDFIQFYSEQEITQLIAETGFTKIGVTNMQQIQKERTGSEFPFISKDSSWINTIFVE